MANRKPRLRLVEIAPFDARKGFSRWVSRGTGYRAPGSPVAHADIWQTPDCRLVTRFTCLGYVDHYEIRKVSGGVIGPDSAILVEEFLSEMLCQWIVQGADEALEGACE